MNLDNGVNIEKISAQLDTILINAIVRQDKEV